MPPEPTVKRTYAFVDGQNLFYAAKKAFGYPYPNYEPKNLATSIASARGWSLAETFFYSGIPDATDNPADEVRAISVEQSRWIKVACAFPSSPTAGNRRGINGTEWIKIDRATYDRSLDPNDYRPKKK